MRGLLMALVLLGAVVAGPSGRADAVGSTATGRPGSVVVQGPQITGNETLTPYGGHRTFSSGGAIVGRSPASNGAQTIAARYQLEMYTSSGWSALAQSAIYHGVVSGSTTRLRFPEWDMVPSRDQTLQQSYRITFLIAWSVNGHVVAAESVYPNRLGEGRCATTQRSCEEHSWGIYF